MSATQTTIAQSTKTPPPKTVMKGDVFTRTILQRIDVPGTKFETVILYAGLVPNASTGRHHHPGVESGFVTEGEGTMFADNQSPIPLKTGDSYKLPFGVTHEMRSGIQGMKVVATWVVAKGEPVATTDN